MPGAVFIRNEYTGWVTSQQKMEKDNNYYYKTNENNEENTGDVSASSFLFQRIYVALLFR